MKSKTDLLVLIAQRSQILRLIANGNRSKHSLTMMLPVSQSTVTRALKALTDAELVQQTQEGYDFTHHGQLAYQAYQQVTNYYETLTAAKPLLQYLPTTASIDRSVFVGATVHCADRTNPDAPRMCFEDRIRHSEDIVGIHPIISQHTLDIYLDQLSSHTPQLSIILDATAGEHLRREYPHKIRTISRADYCAFYACPKTTPFSLVIIDQTELWLGIYDNQGHLKGGLQSESQEAIMWAKQCLQQYSDLTYPIYSSNTVAENSVVLGRQMTEEEKILNQ